MKPAEKENTRGRDRGRERERERDLDPAHRRCKYHFLGWGRWRKPVWVAVELRWTCRKAAGDRRLGGKGAPGTNTGDHQV